MDGASRGVFHGKIIVRPDAQKTDAIQTNKNLLLSREALVNSTPALEILADDVKCRHGSTTGQLDAAALFYLRSRGIGEAEARALLTYAFAADVAEDPRRAVRAVVERDSAAAAPRRRRRSGAPPVSTALPSRAPAEGRPRLRRRGDPPRLSDPRDEDLRQAARLPRQRRLGPEAGGRHRGRADVYERCYANIHRGVHWLSVHATDAYDAAREKARAFVNAAETHEIVFVRGTTEAINLVAQTYGRQRVGAGDEVLITGARAPLEHRAVAAAL